MPERACLVDGTISESQRWPRKRITDTYSQVVVYEEGVGEAEAGVALAEPEEEAADGEQDREGGGGDGVELPAGAESALRCVAAEEPGAVVGIEEVDLVDGAP
jgi:hypothetical protein